MAQVELKNVNKSFGPVHVIKDVDLEINKGEFVVFVGPSGCGKSTLLRFIGGLEIPEAGRIFQIGAPPEGCLNPLTYIFQDFALYQKPFVDYLNLICLNFLFFLSKLGE